MDCCTHQQKNQSLLRFSRQNQPTILTSLISFMCYQLTQLMLLFLLEWEVLRQKVLREGLELRLKYKCEFNIISYNDRRVV